MATQVGKAQIYSLSGTTLAGTNLVAIGFINPLFQSLRTSHVQNDHREIKNSAGEIAAKIFCTDDVVDCTFEYIPSGTSQDNAKLSAGILVQGLGVTISGLPLRVFGSFSDVYNSALWIYEGGASDNLSNTGEMTITLPLRRYKNITSLTNLG